MVKPKCLALAAIAPWEDSCSLLPPAEEPHLSLLLMPVLKEPVDESANCALRRNFVWEKNRRSYLVWGWMSVMVLPREEGWAWGFITACMEGWSEQAPRVPSVGWMVEVWVPAAAVRILLVWGLAGTQVNGRRGIARVACLIQVTSERWEGGSVCFS